MSSITSVTNFPLRTELYVDALQHWPGSSLQHTQQITNIGTARDKPTSAPTPTSPTADVTPTTTTTTMTATSITNDVHESIETNNDPSLSRNCKPHGSKEQDEEEKISTTSIIKRSRYPTATNPIKIILAQYDTDTIVVYQAFHPTIASYAVKNQKFLGCPAYSVGRMTWIKTNFLWMMFRAGWATKPNQECILAITLTRDFFHHLLSLCIPSSYQSHQYETQTEYDQHVTQAKNAQQGFCRLQWDPDHTPTGGIVGSRRAIQIGIKGVTSFAEGKGIIGIHDITDFVKQQYQHVLNNTLSQLVVPVERVYPIMDEQLAHHISVDHIET